MKKIGKRLEKEFMEAMTATLHAYERLIEDPGLRVLEWEDFGTYDSCRICRVFRVDNIDHYEGRCALCPLSRISPDLENQRSAGGCASDKWEELHSALESRDSDDEVKEAAQARYEELLEHLDKAGYSYK